LASKRAIDPAVSVSVLPHLVHLLAGGWLISLASADGGIFSFPPEYAAN
jgi:hypothetical protein